MAERKQKVEKSDAGDSVGAEMESGESGGNGSFTGSNPTEQDSQKRKKRNSNRSQNKRMAQKQCQNSSNNVNLRQKRILNSPEDTSATITVKKAKSNEEMDLELESTAVEIQGREGNDNEGEKPSMRNAVLMNRLAILPEDYPDVAFKEENVIDLEEQILQRIDEIDEGKEAPTFQYRRFEKGYLKVACIGEYTCRWLMDEAKEWKFSGKPIKVIPLKDLPKPPVYRSWIHHGVLPPEKILSRLGKQNKGLDISGWKHKNSVVAQTGFLTYFELDSVSVEYLKTRNYLLFFGMTQIKFTLVNQSSGNTVDDGMVTSKRNDDDPTKIGIVEPKQLKA